MANQALAIRTEGLDVMSVADAFVKSGYFKDAGQQAQAIVKILYGSEVGIGPVSAMMNIHIIEGKPAISSNLMAALIKRSGRYNYRVTYNEADGCELEFTDNGEILGTASFKKADAQLAGCLSRKNWQAYPKAMYFARALSQGARMYCADIFLGAIYETDSGEIADVTPPSEESAPQQAPQTRSQAMANKAQVKLIGELAYATGTEADILAAYKVDSIDALTEKQAAKVIARLQQLKAETTVPQVRIEQLQEVEA